MSGNAKWTFPQVKEAAFYKSAPQYATRSFRDFPETVLVRGAEVWAAAHDMDADQKLTAPVVVGDTFIPLIFPSPLCCILHLCQTLTRNRQGKEREPTVKQVDKLLRQAVPVARAGGVSAVQEKAPPPYRKTAAAAPSRAGHDHVDAINQAFAELSWPTTTSSTRPLRRKAVWRWPRNTGWAA